MFPPEILRCAETIVNEARRQNVHLATAESCTGGLIAACLTEIPGVSDVFERGFLVYTNAAKTEMLGVAAELIERYGAVSQEVASAMVQGALERSKATLGVAVTGIAGPTGGTALKPVGLVHIAAMRAGQAVQCEECRFGDIGRGEVRMKTVDAALRYLHRLL